VRRSTIAAALLTALALGVAGPPATAWGQPPGDDVAACRDGNCTLRVTGPVTIPLDGRAGVTELSVSSIGPFAVEFRVQRVGGGDGLGVVGRGGSVRFTSDTGSLAVRVLVLDPDAAVIELTTQPAQESSPVVE
jgi:hypothetical protein